MELSKYSFCVVKLSSCICSKIVAKRQYLSGFASRKVLALIFFLLKYSSKIIDISNLFRNLIRNLIFLVQKRLDEGRKFPAQNFTQAQNGSPLRFIFYSKVQQSTSSQLFANVSLRFAFITTYHPLFNKLRNYFSNTTTFLLIYFSLFSFKSNNQFTYIALGRYIIK